MDQSSATDMSTIDRKEEVTLNLGSVRPDPHLISATTGGVENSCHVCMMAFGTVVLVIGTSSTGVALFNDSVKSTLFFLGLSLLAIGLVMLAFACLRSRFKKLRGRKGSLTILVSETEQKKPSV